MIHTVLREQQLLRKCGWPITADGKLGPRTRQARRDFRAASPPLARRTFGVYWRRLQRCANAGGMASRHFRFREFASKGNGWIKVRWALLQGLETLRDRVGPIGILSGYRDPAHNARVGGASNSQHVYGNAIDPTRSFALTDVLAVGKFSGIGTQGSASGPVRHVDVRHMGPNTTGGTPDRPTRWIYT